MFVCQVSWSYSGPLRVVVVRHTEYLLAGYRFKPSWQLESLNVRKYCSSHSWYNHSVNAMGSSVPRTLGTITMQNVSKASPDSSDFSYDMYVCLTINIYIYYVCMYIYIYVCM